jgi:N-acetylglucosamine malate deacetylase 2
MMNILAFFAHPDDETMLCGATLALAAAKAKLTVVCATRGEGGEMGDPPLCSRADLGAFRSEELRCAVRELGAQDLIFMDYIDPTISEDNTLHPFTQDEERLAQEICTAVLRLEADVIVSHGSNGEYGHPAHKLCHRAVLRTVEILGSRAPLFYTTVAMFEGHPRPRLANVDDPAHLILDLENFHHRKVAAALCHRTQHALFIRHASQEVGHPVTVPEVVTALESVHRVYPPLLPGESLTDAFASLLRSSGESRENPDWIKNVDDSARD